MSCGHFVGRSLGRRERNERQHGTPGSGLQAHANALIAHDVWVVFFSVSKVVFPILPGPAVPKLLQRQQAAVDLGAELIAPVAHLVVLARHHADIGDQRLELRRRGAFLPLFEHPVYQAGETADVQIPSVLLGLDELLRDSD